MASTTTDKSDTTSTVGSTPADTVDATAATAQPTSTKNDNSSSPKADSHPSLTTTTTAGNDQDKTAAEEAPQSLQAFTTAVFSGGFSAPKINTSSFFSSMRSTLSNTKSPASLVTPQMNKVDMKNLQASTEQLANTTKDWGVSAFKSLSSAAQRVSANVTQGIQKEHEEFVKQKKLENAAPKQGTEAVPAWAGLPDEDQFKSRILSLSKDKRNFLLPPPPGTDFVFDMKVYSSTAMATLKEDPNLNKMRFYLVPKEIEEQVFWRNYFYRVTLLKQVALSTAGLGGSPPDLFSEGFSDSAAESAAEGGSNSSRHGRTLSSSVLGYNIYFGKDDVEGPPSRSRPTSTTVKDFSPPSTTKTTTTNTTTTATTATKVSSKAPINKAVEKKTEVLFEAEMPDHEEDPDAWLEKQLASGISIGDGDDADMDVTDWEKELQNELKDYVEGS
ncbi:hypothetical protein BGZ96_012806 [Linnemannia gamsii]|uniref:BSD domain-containing protein n=1 Tax=Linnemannia gamsii TaxID=64522 RepID=A0ABQ7JQ13_9FUNG|nr:hypothetical protein BGZ96_012806 [Linnemannia gamsii]